MAKTWNSAWKSHKKKMNLLAVKFIGKNTLAIRDKHTDLWFKKMWYINRIKSLMYQAGRCNQALRRCKPLGEKWKQYDETARDMELLADHLADELLGLK